MIQNFYGDTSKTQHLGLTGDRWLIGNKHHALVFILNYIIIFHECSVLDFPGLMLFAIVLMLADDISWDPSIKLTERLQKDTKSHLLLQMSL